MGEGGSDGGEEEGGYQGGGGGGNGGTITASDIENAIPVDDGKPKIQDIKKYLDCFSDGKTAQSYTMTIYADQPIAGQNDAFRIIMPTGGVATNNPYNVPTGIVFSTNNQYMDVGHTFVTFEKNNTDGTNVRQTLGFYPAGFTAYSKGAMEDNSGHVADVSYTRNVTQVQFEAALGKVEDDFINKNYNLTNFTFNEYNCTDAAISWMNVAGANFRDSSFGLFKNTPGAFGQVLRNTPGAAIGPTAGIIGKGPCN